MNTIRRHVKRFLEKQTGLRINPPPPDKHFYTTLARLREWTPQDVIFDVGANDGRTVQKLQALLPDPRIFAFEPVAETYRNLLETTRDYPNVRCFQSAVGSAPGEAEIHVHSIHEMSSLHTAWGESERTELVPVTTVDLVAEREGVERIQFLKVDTEGHELEVLKGAREMLESNRIGIIQLEVRFDMDGTGIPALPEFREFLDPMGYALYGFYNQCRGRGGPAGSATDSTPGRKVLAYCDAVFTAAFDNRRGN